MWHCRCCSPGRTNRMRVGAPTRRCRRAHLSMAAAGVGAAVALLASLGAFLVAAEASMTERAAAGVAVDWQVQVVPGGDPATVLDTVRAAPGVVASMPVAFATADA